VTHAKALGKLKIGKIEATAVECRLETGRTHQIRIHLAEAGHPVLGDAVYGRGTAAVEASNRLLLHAERLGFKHPRTGENMRFEEPLPAGFPLLRS
jgi:23S rRNA pseudouridine1911/1915/1917 synthase